MLRSRWIGALLGLALVGALIPDAALAQTQPRPRVRGRTHSLKIDSSPQQAAVYWDTGDRPSPKDYGIAGYTPMTLKVPRGRVRVLLELAGWKGHEQTLDVRKSQTITLTLERAPQPARLDLQSASDGSAVGAEIVIDGAPRGTLPNAFDLSSGRHQIEVRKSGYKPFTDWLTLNEGERRTRDISLEKAEAPTGTLLVTSDAGGEVYVDGVRKDATPAIITGITAGEHVVEVRKEGLPPWRQTVNVPAGQQAKVAANFGAAASPGSSVRVIASEPDVTVFFDGEDKGKAPITLASVKAGQHIIEGRKKLFKTNEQNIRLAPGENALVQLKMEPAPPDRPHAGMKVQSTTPNAEVFVDGSSLGRAPVDRNDLDPGKHYVVVHKDGYTDFKREVFLLENQSITLVADLSATGALRVLSTPDGADVRIDGELIGKTPISRDTIQAGDHVVEFRLRGYYDKKETMKVEGGREKIFSVDLKQIPTGPSPEQTARRKQMMSSFGARVNPVGGFTADFGGGYPYYFTLRLMVGAYPLKPKGLDLGVEFQTFFQIYNLAIAGKWQLVEAGPLSVALRGDIGGGTGTAGRDTRFLDLQGIVSLAFSDVAAVSGTLRYSAWSDKFCPSGAQIRNGVTPENFCMAGVWDRPPPDADPGDPRPWFTKDPNGNRFSGSRLYLGINATAALDRMTSVFLQLEFLPFPDSFSWEPRPAFLDRNNSSMAQKDTYVYGMGGVSLKF